MQWFLSFLLVAAVATQQALAGPLDPKDDVCQSILVIGSSVMSMTCTGVTDGSQITEALVDVTELDTLSVIESPALTTMPDDAFGSTVIQHLEFHNTGLESLSASAFSASTGDALLSLYIKDCTAFATIESTLIAALPALENLYVSGSGLTVLDDPLPPTSLQYIDFDRNAIHTIVDDYFAAASKLKVALLASNGFNTCALCKTSQTFAGYEDDLYLDFGWNQMENGVKYMEFPKAAPRELILSGNQMTVINGTYFVPLMEQMASQYEKPYILLDNNPFTCGCELSWVVDNPNRALLKNALCENGQLVDNLTSEDFADCP